MTNILQISKPREYNRNDNIHKYFLTPRCNQFHCYANPGMRKVSLRAPARIRDAAAGPNLFHVRKSPVGKKNS